MERRKAFTLVELVIVLVILAILVSLALPTFMGTRQRAYRAEALQILSELKTLVWAYNLEHGGTESATAWPTKCDWSTIGYLTRPQTDNWNFTGFYGTSNYMDSGNRIECQNPFGSNPGCFRIDAVPRPGSAAEGLKNISLLVSKKGEVFIDYDLGEYPTSVCQ